MLLETAYMAGLFDGEGSITITKPSASCPTRYRLIAQVAMTHEPTIEAIRATFGGRIQRIDQSKYNPRASNRFDWRIQDTGAAEFIALLEPWLITKKKQADIARRFAATRNTRGMKLTESDLEARELLRLELKEANVRGKS